MAEDALFGNDDNGGTHIELDVHCFVVREGEFKTGSSLTPETFNCVASSILEKLQQSVRKSGMGTRRR